MDQIRVKRDGGALSDEQIGELVAGCVSGAIPDYQIAAWLMAVYFRGMRPKELAALTRAMVNSGEVYDLSAIPGVTADKHSTGGVGDKVSLVLAPLAAACGLYVPMVSGRGLGHTGGTLDKLESIPGLTTRLSRGRFIRQLKKIGLAMAGQTKKFVPADRMLYALRDVTSTVESIPLISASIMSKKLAEGTEVLVLDVKTGNGAFMQKQADAVKLAKTMVGIGQAMGRKVSAMITDMSQPLGRAVGNANEVAESIEALKGGGPADLMEVTFALTARMLTLAKLAKHDKEAREQMDRAIQSGAALEKFRLMIEAQGGDPRVIDDPRRLPSAPHKAVIKAPHSGYLASFDTRKIGVAASILGAGRAVANDMIDPAVGISIEAKIGEKIGSGQPLFNIYYRETKAYDSASTILMGSFTLEAMAPKPNRIILKADTSASRRH